MYHMLTVLSLFGTTAADVNTSNVSYPSQVDVDVERVTRSFRIQVYNTFRNERDEYDQRREVGNTVFRSFLASSQEEQDRTRVIDWYRQAIVASETGNVSDLPDAPGFGTSSQTSDSTHSSRWDGKTTDPPAVTEKARTKTATEADLVEESDEYGVPNSQEVESGNEENSGQDSYPVLGGLGRAVMSAVGPNRTDVNENSAQGELNLETSDPTTADQWEQPAVDLFDEEDENTEENPVIRYVEPPQVQVELTQPE